MTAIITIDVDSPTPVYRQISEALRTLLVSGAFQPGDKLPTVRELALDLGVNHNTVAQSYQKLAEEGWISMRRRHGVTVLKREQPNASVETEESFQRRLANLVAEASTEGVRSATIAKALQTLAKQVEAGLGFDTKLKDGGSR